MKHRMRIFVVLFVAGIAALIYSIGKKEASDLEALSHIDDEKRDEWDDSDLFEED